jgi:hypothetical protein
VRTGDDPTFDQEPPVSQIENPDEAGSARPRDYAIGYGRPPVATRFQPGNNCNPRGRPKQKKTVGDEIQAALNTKVRIPVAGKMKTMTKQQVIIQNLVNAAARGDGKAIHRLFALAERYQDSAEATIDPSDLNASDRRIIEGFLANTSSHASNTQPLASGDQDGASIGETSDDAAEIGD